MGFFEQHEFEKESLPRCHRCGLDRKCLSPRMVPSGSGKRSILFVGEAPGKNEDSSGLPFIGQDGQYLRDVLEDLDCDLDDCIVTNSIICRPPDNKMSRDYLVNCRPALSKTIRDTKPHVIITLGNWALEQTIFDDYTRFNISEISKWRGWCIPHSGLGAWVCPTYHPFYVVRSDGNPVIEKQFHDDLQLALSYEKKSLESYQTLKQLENQVDIILDEGEAERRLLDLCQRKGRVAFDYETTCLKPENYGAEIVSCSFCYEGRETWACPMTDNLRAGMVKFLTSKNLSKIASNLKFEERWSLEIFECPVSNWMWDTMLAAHCLDNRPGICSLKFQAFIHLGIGGYDEDVKLYLASGDSGINRVKQIPIKRLLLYNGLDSLLEFLVMERQLGSKLWM